MEQQKPKIELGEVLRYEQPTKYIVKSTRYKHDYPTPVLTAGKSFILGYTDEKDGIFPKEKLPVIIFDDFTTAIKFVDFPFKVKSSAMKILHADKNKADIKFLFYAMQEIVFTVRKHKRHWISEYSKIKIFLPPLAEQKRIADKLDRVFSEIEKAKKAISAATDRGAQFTLSLLKKTFDDKSFQQITLEALTERMKAGGTPNTSIKDYWGGEIAFVKISDITASGKYLENTASTVTQEGVDNSSSWIVPKGSLILSMYGTVGKIVINKIPVAITQNMAGIIPDEKKILPEYLYYALNFVETNVLPAFLKTSVHQHFGIGEAKKIPIPIPQKDGKPDLAEQKHIADELDKAFALSEQLRTLFVRQEKSFGGLRASVLSDAFKPVPQTIPVVVPVPVTVPRMFDIQQAVALILKRFERGEMVVAKMLYLAQSIYQVPLGIQFSAQNFGPYDSAVKKAVTAGLSPRNKFFAKKGSGNTQVLSLGANASKILKYANSALARKMNNYLNEMMPHFSASNSSAIERLATICKIIEDAKTADEKIIKEKLHEWKPNKFQDAEVSRTIAFIKKNKWDAQLVK